MKDYAAIAKEYYAAMIDAKAIGEHALADQYCHIYIRYKTLAAKSQPDINTTDINQT